VKQHLLKLAVFALAVGPGSAFAGDRKALSVGIEGALVSKIETLKAKLGDKIFVETITTANSASAKLSQAEIESLDRKWRAAKGVDDFIRPYLANPCSEKLLDIQEEVAGLSELFLTDVRGLNVCQTNKTSDLYQADEDWWVQTFAGGKGKDHHGELEYDESAKAESIPLYIALRASGSEEVIGVLKAVIDVTALSEG
jgi:hypothetical protein